MVVSAAHAQQAGLTSGVGGGAMNDSALEESVDERQIREGVHTENSEVSTEVTHCFCIQNFNTFVTIISLCIG